MKSFLHDFHLHYWLAEQLNHCPDRPDRRDLRVRLVNSDLEEPRNTSTTGGNDLACPSRHTLQNGLNVFHLNRIEIGLEILNTYKKQGVLLFMKKIIKNDMEM